MKKSERFVLWFNEIDVGDIPLVGGKNASLGEMYQNLAGKGVNVPNGFAISAFAYRYMLEKSGVLSELKGILRGVSARNVSKLQDVGRRARDLILRCEIPVEVEREIISAYEKLSRESRSKGVDVAVRSSATAEDLPDASFAGQQETFLNVCGIHALLDSVKRCFASLFTNRAIAYREENNYDHFDVALSVGVQRMVRSDLACSGVIFTIDTESGFSNAVLVTASLGLGESVVQGLVSPDEFVVFKPTLRTHRPIIRKSLGGKESKIIYSDEGSRPVKSVPTLPSERGSFCLSDDEVLMLSSWALDIEEHYSTRRGKLSPMDIEWAKDGRTHELFIVQARPETVQSRKSRVVLEEYVLKNKSSILATGKSVGNRIGSGVAHVIKSVHDIGKFRAGEVLVTEMTDPDWVPVMRLASAIVTNSGGRTSHAAIVSRELGLPCVVGTIDATSAIKSGQKVTVSCAQGDVGLVYSGLLKFDVVKTNISHVPKTKTKIMMNIGSPDEAFELSFLPNDGVGLAREEFIVSEYIKVHPLALVNFSKLDSDTKKLVENVTVGYSDKREFFVDRLSQGVGMIAAAFYPNPVIVRLSDFKSNEYANLIGGKIFEPVEQNPMLGWRGASRYYSDEYRDAFGLECEALRRVRDVFGLSNVKLMIPMCRSPEEGRKVLNVMESFGLRRGKNGLEVYVMCELPVNVVLADKFSEIFDGFSIGSNDLTQTTLGVDRDSERVAGVFDERNEAVLRLMEEVIRVAKRFKRKIGICGDAPSTYPQIAKFLVDCGIDSISLSPDAIVRTRLLVSKYEKR